jgi:hypothetical protein
VQTERLNSKLRYLLRFFALCKRPYISPVSSLISCVPQRSACASEKNGLPTSQCLWISRRRGTPFLFFAGTRPARHAGSSQPLISEGAFLGGRNGPRAPARGGGGGVRGSSAGGTAAGPVGHPRPPYLVAGLLRCPPRPGEQKNGPGRPLGAPTKSRGLTKLRPRPF